MKIFIVNRATDYSVFHRLMLNTIRYVTEAEDIIYLTQHKPVITMGKDTDPNNILGPIKNIPVYRVERGGDVTLHSPGQLMVYPLIKLDRRRMSIIDLIRILEESVIKYIDKYGLSGYWIKGTAGVWVNNRKIASIGIGLKKWVTYHGMAFNICNDLNLFKLINPCGLSPSTMTNLSRETGQQIKIDNNLIEEYLEIMLKLLSIEKKDVEIVWLDNPIDIQSTMASWIGRY